MSLFFIHLKGNHKFTLTSWSCLNLFEVNLMGWVFADSFRLKEKRMPTLDPRVTIHAFHVVRRKALLRRGIVRSLGKSCVWMSLLMKQQMKAAENDHTKKKNIQWMIHESVILFFFSKLPKPRICIKWSDWPKDFCSLIQFKIICGYKKSTMGQTRKRVELLVKFTSFSFLLRNEDANSWELRCLKMKTQKKKETLKKKHNAKTEKENKTYWTESLKIC